MVLKDYYSLPLDKLRDKMKVDGLTLGSLNRPPVPNYFKQWNVAQIDYILKLVAEELKLQLEAEPYFYLMCDAKMIIIQATAGAGKTTITEFKAWRGIVLRGLSPRRVCFLSFSTGSVLDIARKWKYMSEAADRCSMKVGCMTKKEEQPIIRSLNSLTYGIANQVRTYWDLTSDIDIIQDTEAFEVMKRILVNRAQVDNSIVVNDKLVKSFLGIHDLCNSLLATPEDLKTRSIVVNTGVEPAVIESILQVYRSQIMMQNKLHHSDTCRLIVELCRVADEAETWKETHPGENCPYNELQIVESRKIQELLAKAYDLIIIDESQDMSKCVYELIRYMLRGNTKAWIIGDDDQRIYDFNGALPGGLSTIKKDYPNAVFAQLSLNRRCPKEVLEYAQFFLNSITDREPMEVRGNHDGGKVNTFYYKDRKEVLNKIAAELKLVKKDNLRKICIAYRKNITCFFIIHLFMELGIPFQIKDDLQPGSDLLSRNLNGILSLLRSPSNAKYIQDFLYKVCSISKMPTDMELVAKVLGRTSVSKKELKNPKLFAAYIENIFDLEDIEYFYEIPPKYFGIQRGSSEEQVLAEFEVMGELSRKIQGKTPLSKIMECLLPYFNKRFWNYVSLTSNYPEELQEIVLKEYFQNIPYLKFKKDQLDREKAMREAAERDEGVYLSSMHMLKGLEYDEVHVIELAGGIVPLINLPKDATDDEYLRALNDELRLLYVAFTRAKKVLNTYWSSDNPSVFEAINQEYLISLNVESGILNNIDSDVEIYEQDLTRIPLVLTNDTTDDLKPIDITVSEDEIELSREADSQKVEGMVIQERQQGELQIIPEPVENNDEKLEELLNNEPHVEEVLEEPLISDTQEDPPTETELQVLPLVNEEDLSNDAVDLELDLGSDTNSFDIDIEVKPLGIDVIPQEPELPKEDTIQDDVEIVCKTETPIDVEIAVNNPYTNLPIYAPQAGSLDSDFDSDVSDNNDTIILHLEEDFVGLTNGSALKDLLNVIVNIPK